MSEKYNYCHIAELTDKGCKRAANEDWLIHFESPNGLVAVVCDGMGGHVGGQVASHTAIDAIHQYMMQERGGTPFEQIVEAMNFANAAILNRAQQQPELTGMGSTCVMLVVYKGKVYIGSVGDSRVYLVRNHKIKQLTVDQSYVQMLVDSGSITPEEAERHPRKNEITNALGLKGMQPATVLSHITPEAGDCFLLCSDGLSGMVSDKDIEKVVSRQSEKTQQERVEELVIRAKRNGGLDNITCQLVEFPISPESLNGKSWLKDHPKYVICASIISVLLIVMGIWLAFGNYSKEEEQHNVEVEKLLAECDSTMTIDSVFCFVNNDFFILNEYNGLGVKIVLSRSMCGELKDTVINIRDSISAKRIDVVPSSYIRKEYSDDSTICRLSIVKEIPTDSANEIAIKLYGKKTYAFLVPLERPKEKIQTSQAFEKKKDEMEETDFKDNNKKKGEIVGDYTFNITKVPYVILVNGGDNAEADQKLLCDSVAISEKPTEKAGYKLETNGQWCKVTINEKPKSDYRILIRTRPEINNDEKGIILRIRKG